MRCVTIKTLQGACACVVQRFQCPIRGETTYLELSEQRCEGSMSTRLAECSAYYSNRMSYVFAGICASHLHLHVATRYHIMAVTRRPDAPTKTSQQGLSR